MPCWRGPVYVPIFSRPVIWRKPELSHSLLLSFYLPAYCKLGMTENTSRAWYFVHAGCCSIHLQCPPAAALFPRRRTRACGHPPRSGQSKTSRACGVYRAAIHTHTHASFMISMSRQCHASLLSVFHHTEKSPDSTDVHESSSVTFGPWGKSNR